MDLGALIGGAIAGGFAGAGGAAKTSMASSQEAIQKEELMQHEQEAIGMREMALQQSSQAFQGDQGDKNRALTADQGDKSRANAFDIAKMGDDTSRANAQLSASTQITTTGMNNATTLAAERMRVAAQAQALAQSHFSPIQDGNGNFAMYNEKTGQAQPLLIDGQQVKGPKNMSSTDSAMVAVLTKTITDPTATAEEKASAQGMLRDIGSGKGIGATPNSTLSMQKQQRLTAAYQAAAGGDPAAVAKLQQEKQWFDTASKVPGAADNYLNAYTKASSQIQQDPNVWMGAGGKKGAGSGMPSATAYGDTGVPGTPPLPSGGPNAGTVTNPYMQDAPVNKPPLINGNLPAPTAAPVDDVAATTAALAQRGTAQPPMPAAPAPVTAPVAPMGISNTQPGSPLITGAQGMVMSNGRLVPAGSVGAPQI